MGMKGLQASPFREAVTNEGPSSVCRMHDVIQRQPPACTCAGEPDAILTPFPLPNYFPAITCPYPSTVDFVHAALGSRALGMSPVSLPSLWGCPPHTFLLCISRERSSRIAVTCYKWVTWVMSCVEWWWCFNMCSQSCAYRAPLGNAGLIVIFPFDIKLKVV